MPRRKIVRRVTEEEWSEPPLEEDEDDEEDESDADDDGDEDES
jgi:hypothetical protein